MNSKAKQPQSILVIEAGRSEQQYWKDLWRYRELLYFLAWRDILVSYKQTEIGIIWALIRPFLCDIEIQADTSRKINSLSLIIFDRSGFKLVNTDTLLIGKILNIQAGQNRLQLRIDDLHLNPGIYNLALWLNDNGEILDYIKNVTEIEIQSPVTAQLYTKQNADGVINCKFDVYLDALPSIPL
jgi:hypothetical protein